MAKAPNKTKQSKNPKMNPAKFYQDKLEVPAEIQAELLKQGLHGRWLNRTQLQKSFGFHRSGYRPYIHKDAKGNTLGSKNPFSGTDAEGLISRGDMVLGVKSIEDYHEHKEHIKYLTKLTQGYNKRAAQELQELSNTYGVETDIDEGYGASDSDDSED